jgi:hypothetical protein
MNLIRTFIMVASILVALSGTAMAQGCWYQQSIGLLNVWGTTNADDIVVWGGDVSITVEINNVEYGPFVGVVHVYVDLGESDDWLTYDGPGSEGGTAPDFTIYGKGGDDSAVTGDGDDYFVQGSGGGTVSTKGGDDHVEGGEKADVVFTGTGNDEAHGYGSPNDVLWQQGSADYHTGFEEVH